MGSEMCIRDSTNEDAEDFKIEKTKDLEKKEWETFIPAREEVLIGGLIFLNNWIIRSETSNALSKLILRNPKNNEEEEIFFSEEKVIVPGVSLTQRNRNTDTVYLSYSSPKTPGRTYLYLSLIHI